MKRQRKAARTFHLALGLLVLMAGMVAPTPQQARAETITFGDPAFADQWNYSDKAVSDVIATRSWLWGPPTLPEPSIRREPMSGSLAHGDTHAGFHLVQYFDKGRMEFNARDGIVTNGRLVVEMMTGNVQTGLDDQYFPIRSSDMPIAGERGGTSDNPAPNYASLLNIATIGGIAASATPLSPGTVIRSTYFRSGTIGTLGTVNPVAGTSSPMPRIETFYRYGSDSHAWHNIPDVFWAFLHQGGEATRNNIWLGGHYDTREHPLPLFQDWVKAMGLPITEPYWTQVRIGATTQWILFQAFERRTLTYNPANSSIWRVEMGNAGQHYKNWRPGTLGRPYPLEALVLQSSTGGTAKVCPAYTGDYRATPPTTPCQPPGLMNPRAFITSLHARSWAETFAGGWMLLQTDNALYNVRQSARLVFTNIDNSVTRVFQPAGGADYVHAARQRINVEVGILQVTTIGTRFSVLVTDTARLGEAQLSIIVPSNGGSVMVQPSPDPSGQSPAPIIVSSGQTLVVIAGRTPLSSDLQPTSEADEQYWAELVRRLQNIPGLEDITKQSGASGGTTPTPVPGSTSMTCPTQFADVSPNDALSVAALCLACRDIVSAYTCGGPGEPCNANFDPYFRPQNNATRGQIAKAVSAAAGYSDPAGTRIYEDVPETSPFFIWIQRLSNRGLVGGYPCASVPDEPCVGPENRPYFRPNGEAAQGLVAKIVSNAANFQEAVNIQTFEDVPPSHTFYVYIERLTARKVITGYPCGGPGEPCGPTKRPYLRPQSSVIRGQLTMIIINTFLPNC